MLKKLLAFICGLAPVGAAVAADNTPVPVQDITTLDGYVSSDTTNVIMGGGVVVGNDTNVAVKNAGLSALVVKDVVGDALDVADAMNVFVPVPDLLPGGGAFYISNEVSRDGFSLRVDGDVTIGGLLTAEGGSSRIFSIENYTDGVTFDVSIGSISNSVQFNVSDVANFTSGGIFNVGQMTVNATESITTGTVDVGAGGVSLAVSNADTGVLSVAGLTNSGVAGNVVNMSAANIYVGNIQNAGSSGIMNINVVGKNLTATGVVENSGIELNIDAAGADVVVNETMNNTAGKMDVTAGSLTVNGGVNASLVNSADLLIDVSGKTAFVNGLSLNMTEEHWDDIFSLKTGSLVIGGNSAAIFANNLNSYAVVVNSAFETDDVSNGSLNSNADMYLAANGLTVAGVTNNAGGMKLESLGNSALNADFVTDKAGAVTGLTAGGQLTVDESVIANGDMTLSGQQVSVGEIVGNGGKLTMSATNADSGAVTVGGDVLNKNAGTVDISGRQINIVGNINNVSGVVAVDGSDLAGKAIHIGGLTVDGGAVTLNGLLGVEISQTTFGEDTMGSGALVVNNGALNFDVGTHVLTINGPATSAGYVADVAGNVIATQSMSGTGNGDMFVTAYGPMGFVLNANGAMHVGGNVVATDTGIGAVARTLTFASDNMNIDGNVTANGDLNKIVFQGAPESQLMGIPVSDLMVGGGMLASNGGTIEIHSQDISVKSLTEDAGAIYVYGDGVNTSQLDITTDDALIKTGITFNSASTVNKGLIINDMPSFTLNAMAQGQDLDVFGGIDVGDGAELTLNVGYDLTVSGITNVAGKMDIGVVDIAEFNNDVTVSGALDIEANYIGMTGIMNAGSISLDSDSNISVGVLQNTQTATNMDMVAGDMINIVSIDSVAGNTDMTADTLDVEFGMDITGGTITLNTTTAAAFGGDVNVSGVLNQGANQTGMLNLVANNIDFFANNLTVGGFVADSQFVTYNVEEMLNINGDVTIGTDSSLATVHFNAQNFANTSGDVDNPYMLRNYGAFALDVKKEATFDDIINYAAMTVSASNAITMGAVQNKGTLSLDSGAGLINMADFENDNGTVQLYGMGLDVVGGITTSGKLYQDYSLGLSSGDININEDSYSITAANITIADIVQAYGATLDIFSSDVDINGDIDVYDLTIAANPDTDWLDLDVTGNVSGGVKIWNLEQMTIGGDYIFDNNSQLLAAILPYNVTPGLNSTTRNYWSTVSLNDDSTFGQITNASDGAALIQLTNGKFTSGTKYDANLELNSVLSDGQIGLRFNDVENVSASTAIWLLSAEKGVTEFSNLEKIRNLNVMFCNAGNTTCVTLNPDNLGAYISVRDALYDDGVADSLYVVFDPRFGGPVLIENNRIQPIVARQPGHSDAEYTAAGALDNLISGQLLNAGFFNKSPIEVIPAVFAGTNVETLMTQLYDRMEYYVETADGKPFVSFSRLVQPREIEQIAGAIVMNEHVSFRNFEDRMMDEFIWNRNRSLQKTWADFDIGMFSQDVADNKRVYGNRFEWSGGFDWQESDTLILGLTGRISHTSSDNDDSMDLAYLPGTDVVGNVSVEVDDTNVGLGAYLMKTLGQKFRAYGNAFLDLHLLDTTRYMTFVNTVEGTGTALSLMTEWGLTHDWLNQYIVGNLYARAGYNFGFSVTEKSADENYMDLESDGYLMLTPGYSLMAQKRIYPSSWFQVRPYATIGVEYDVLGAPDFARYKFAAANTFSKYDIEIDPLWANIGGGFEFLSANGLQFGIDYRYQYNNDMQLHNIKVSGSYRF